MIALDKKKNIFLKRAVLFVIIFIGANLCFAEVKSIEQALMLKDYVQAIKIAEKCLNSESCQKEKVLFLLGEAYIGNTNLVKARETFRTLYKEYRQSLYTKEAVLRIGDSYYLESNYSQAKKVYNFFINKYKDDNFLPYVYLKLAYCQEKLGNWKLKRKYMDLLKENFPQSIEATKLKELEKRGFHFVIQAGAFISKSNALKLIKSLKKEGIEASLVQEKENGRLFYKVRAGSFLKRKDAEDRLEFLLGKGYPARIFP